MGQNAGILLVRTGVIIAKSRYWIVSQDAVDGAMRLTRSPDEYASLAELDACFHAINAALDRAGRAGQRMLIDLREAPLRNDPAFEQAFARHRVAMQAGFARIAVVVRTEVGRLQVLRHAREDGRDVQVFYDEPSAIAYLELGDDDDDAAESA